MNTVHEMIEFTLIALQTMFIPDNHFSRVVIMTSVIMVAFFIVFFRKNLKYNIVLSAAGLYLGLTVKLVLFFVLFVFLPTHGYTVKRYNHKNVGICAFRGYVLLV